MRCSDKSNDVMPPGMVNAERFPVGASTIKQKARRHHDIGRAVRYVSITSDEHKMIPLLENGPFNAPILSIFFKSEEPQLCLFNRFE